MLGSQEELNSLIKISNELYKDMCREDYTDNHAQIAHKYFASTKYKQFYQKYPIVGHVILYNQIFDEDALVNYYNVYVEKPIQDKERYELVNKTYLTSLPKKKLKGINTPTFIQFHLAIMDNITSMKKVDDEKKERIAKLRAKTNRDLLRQRLGTQ